MWPYMIAGCNDGNRINSYFIQWCVKIKENNEYFRFEDNNSKIIILKKGTIRVAAHVQFYNLNADFIDSDICINGSAKQRLHNHCHGSIHNRITNTIQGIFEVNMNDFIQIYSNYNPYGSPRFTRLQIEMLTYS